MEDVLHSKLVKEQYAHRCEAVAGAGNHIILKNLDVVPQVGLLRLQRDFGIVVFADGHIPAQELHVDCPDR